MYEMREINNREQNKLAQCYRSYRCYFAILLVSTFVSIILLSVFINMHTQSLYTEIALKETKNISTTVTANESDNQITKKPKHSTTTSSTTGTTTSHTLSTIISTTIALTAIASTTITSTTITPTKMDEENITETTTNRTRYINKESQNNILNDTSSTTSSLPNDAGNTKYIHSPFEKYTANAIFGTTETITALISSNHSTTMIVPTSYDTNLPSTTIFPNKTTNDICNTSYCRQIASKMLSYMNVSVNPCNDFYKYACGDFETNPQLKDIDLIQRNKVDERIEKQMMKEKQENVSSTFATYYDSCVKYESTANFSEKIKMASKQLKKVGEFYINRTVCENANFTNLFAQLILHHSALLFDVVPEVDEDGLHNFTLKISPTTYENFFETEFINSSFGNDLKTDSNYEDPKPLCSNNKRKKTDRKDEIKRSISKALKELHVFKNNSYLTESECINETINVIDSAIMQTYFSSFSSENNNKEVYLIEHYKRISLKELEKENNSTFINWTHLIDLLLETNNITNKDIQVYFHNKLLEGLRNLVNFANMKCLDLNNVIMALYAHKLYQELVLPKQNASDHCLQVATYFLRPEATNLYISSFADHEIERMNNRTTNMFNELKQTLKWKINATRLKEERKQILLNKTESLKLALPPVSYLKNRGLLHDNNTFQNTLSENYFDNSISLMKRYRILMYTEIRREFNISEQIWTYYATPFQLQAKMIYCLSQIAIPYGMIELYSTSNEDSFNYVEQTMLGNLIAHQIVHHFDKLDYWNLTENTHLFEIFKNSSININTIEKTEPLPSTNQTKCSKLILNEKSSEIIKFTLVKETLNCMSPLMKFDIKLFYLAYAQTYCSKSQFTSSHVALYENENLRNRDRITVVKSNDEFFAETWNCSNSQNIQSRINPKHRKCD